MACFKWEVEVEIREGAAHGDQGRLEVTLEHRVYLPFLLTGPLLIRCHSDLAWPFPTADPKVGRAPLSCGQEEPAVFPGLAPSPLQLLPLWSNPIRVCSFRFQVNPRRVVSSPVAQWACGSRDSRMVVALQAGVRSWKLPIAG